LAGNEESVLKQQNQDSVCSKNETETLKTFKQEASRTANF